MSEEPFPYVEEVFKLSGVPTYTFVAPVEFGKLTVALRSPGRGVVIEGPSGIGKTTAVTRALADLGQDANVLSLSARKPADRELIAELPSIQAPGTVLIDDFHRLDETVRRSIADYLKVMADEERTDAKFIIVGINKAGESLIRFASDLVNRIDIIRLEANPDDRVRSLVTQGSKALDATIYIADDIVAAASGSYYIAQLLCQEACVSSGIMQRTTATQHTNVSHEVVVTRVMDRLSARFMPIATSFASGTKLRREGRAPYLHILRWLAEAQDWSIDLEREAARHPELKGSVSQVVDKGFLSNVLTHDPAIGDCLHFDAETRVLAVEDPQFVFFIRNLWWNKFAERVGYLNVKFDSPYDFALSFAGGDRSIAEALFEALSQQEFAVFYDKEEQHRILAENIEDYLGPIYRSEATYVIPLLSKQYPERIWTQFESKQFEDRFGKGAVIPIWFSDVGHGMFDKDRKVGGLTYKVGEDLSPQVAEWVELLTRKVRDRALQAHAKSAADPQEAPSEQLELPALS